LDLTNRPALEDLQWPSDVPPKDVVGRRELLQRTRIVLPGGKEVIGMLAGLGVINKGDLVRSLSIDFERRPLSESVQIARNLCRDVEIDSSAVDEWYDKVKSNARESVSSFSKSNNTRLPPVTVEIRRQLGEGDAWFVVLKLFWN
jgi:hypothetical protein